MPGGRPKLTEEQRLERKERIREKNSRYYQAHKDKWQAYNNKDTYYMNQIRYMAQHLDETMKQRVLELFPAEKN